MRRTLTTALAAAALAAAIPAAAVNVDTGQFPACQSGTGFTCHDLFIDSFDATQIDATVYVPTASGSAPAVLMTHGYGGWHRGGGDAAFARLWAAKGYVVLAYTSRGFGRSSGQVQLDSPMYEVQDARHLVTWLAKRNADAASPLFGKVQLDGANDPRIGMVGGSYGGGIQLLTASYDGRLDAITPQITWRDLRYSLSPNGAVKHGWIDLLYASGKYGGYLGPIGTVPPPVIGTDGVPVDQDLQVATSYVTNDSMDTPVAYTDGSNCTNTYCYLKFRSPVYANVIDDIAAATLLIQGQQDTLFWVNEAEANYWDIRDNASSPATKLVVFSAGHGYADLAGERDAINARIESWFERHLRGDATEDTGPDIEYWQPWVAGSNFAELDVADRGSASPGATPAAATIVNAVAPTSHSETTNFQPTTSSPSMDAGDGVTAATFDLDVPTGTVLAGAPRVEFDISATAPEAIVFAKLWDVDGAGNRSLIHHLVTPARIRGGDGDFCSDSIPAQPSASLVGNVHVCLPMAWTAWKAETGHSLQLSLATTDTMHLGSRFPGVYQISNLEVSLTTHEPSP